MLHTQEDKSQDLHKSNSSIVTTHLIRAFYHIKPVDISEEKNPNLIQGTHDKALGILQDHMKKKLQQYNLVFKKKRFEAYQLD